MAHQIEENDKFGEVRKNGERAWHGLGIEIPEGLNVTEGFDAIGLGWSTELIEVFGRRPAGNEDGTTQEIAIPDFRAHIRSDTGNVLGIVSNDYRPIQNKTLAEFADALVGQDKAMRLETGGSLRNGRRVWALCKLPSDTVIKGEDVTRDYLLLTNANDGTGGCQGFFTPIRVVCANTMGMALSANGRSGFNFSHTGDITQKIELARQALGIVVQQQRMFGQKMRVLAQCKLDARKLGRYFDDVYSLTWGSVENATPADKKHRENIISTFKANMDIPRNTVKATAGTLWQAFNAVTFYHDHQRGRLKDVASSDARVHSNLFGTSAHAKGIAARAAFLMAAKM